MKKESKFDWGQLATALAVGVSAATIGVFADEILDWLKENNLKGQSKEYYRKMLEAHPQLKKEDPKLVGKYWASLYHFAPYMAQDPLAAGAYIRQTMKMMPHEEFGGPSVDTYSTLAGINKAVAETKERKARGVGTEIGVGAASKVMGDVLTQNVSGYADKKDEAIKAIKGLRSKYEKDREQDKITAKRMVTRSDNMLKKLLKEKYSGPKFKNIKRVGGSDIV